MAGERYFKATLGSVSAPVYVSAEFAAEVLKYLDPSTNKLIPIKAVQKKASGEVRTNDDCSALWGTTVENETIVFDDAAGTSDLTLTLPKVSYSEWSGETGAEDSKPAMFSLKLDAEVPAAL